MAGELAIMGLLGIFFVIAWMIMIAVMILGFIFWVFMLIDVIKRKFIKEDDKVVWIIVVALTGWIGALIYYFVIKRKDNISDIITKKK